MYSVYTLPKMSTYLVHTSSGLGTYLVHTLSKISISRCSRKKVEQDESFKANGDIKNSTYKKGKKTVAPKGNTGVSDDEWIRSPDFGRTAGYYKRTI